MRKGRTAAALSALVLLIGLVGTACGEGESSAPAPTTSPPAAGERVFTPAELAEFDGTDGRAAYVAVDGVVYDLSGQRNWSQGEHGPCNLNAMAGRDLSAEIQEAPARMRTLLEEMPVVGSLE